MKSLSTLTAVAITLCVANAMATSTVNDDTKLAAEKLGALEVAELDHSTGQVGLTKSDKQDLNKTIAEAKAAGKISEVKVISWADREYPANDQSASKGDIQLAADRAQYLKDYLKERGVKSITTYNMAKRPNSVQELFKTSQARVKDELASNGAAPQSDSEAGFMGFKGKASETLVLVFVK